MTPWKDAMSVHKFGLAVSATARVIKAADTAAQAPAQPEQLPAPEGDADGR